MNLNDRQAKFLSKYLETRNATTSAIAAGYSPNGAAQSASKLLRHPKIAEAIAEMRSNTAAKTSETIQRIDRIAFTDIADADIKPEHVIKALDMRARIDGLYQDQASGTQQFLINIHLNTEVNDES